MKTILILLLASTSAWAQVQPVPKVGSCPSGFYTSGNYCVPMRTNTAQPAIAKVGSCPPGYYSSGNYCVKSK